MNDKYPFWKLPEGETATIRFLDTPDTLDEQFWLNPEHARPQPKCTIPRKPEKRKLRLFDPESGAPLDMYWEVSETTYNILSRHLGDFK